MQKLTAEMLIRLVEKSQLVDPQKLKRFEKKLRNHHDGKLPSDVKLVGRLLVKNNMVTAWHLEKLYLGKYKGFFLGKYKLLGHIGTGGMSSVYLAEHTKLNHKRAIKVLPKKRVSDSSYLARFELEAKAIASLNHPNIVTAYDIDNIDDVHYMVMEYVDGLDLQALVKRDGALDPSLAADLVAQAARGLQHAHDNGVVHRDVKPANLLLDEKDRVRLLDMGLALMDEEEEASLTMANNENVLGTADYLAPEQAIDSHSVDHRADIYALGCTMYYLLTGQPPFNKGTLAQRIAMHQTEMPQPIRSLRPSVPGELEGICVKMIQKQPEYRYQRVADVAEALEKFVAKVPKGQKVVIGLGDDPGLPVSSSSSSISLDDPFTAGTGTGTGDTLSNKNDDTMTSSRKRLVEEGLSPSDSGKLVSVKRPEVDFDEASYLNLQAESGYQQPASSRPASASDSSSSVGIGSESRKGGSGSGSGKRPDISLIIALMVAFFMVAITIGFILARAVG